MSLRGFFTGFTVAVAAIIIVGFIALMLFPDLIIIFIKADRFLRG